MNQYFKKYTCFSKYFLMGHPWLERVPSVVFAFQALQTDPMFPYGCGVLVEGGFPKGYSAGCQNRDKNRHGYRPDYEKGYQFLHQSLGARYRSG
ncbi:hypothetical protein [Thermotalea metallivorans]|uniref:hypothetical protein n=1 Tax=Thermotalea metallivorans TaxID=520762 RepID=UPI0012ED8C39|nr:hypothetical protein [Thermotalea metallivorans]